MKIKALDDYLKIREIVHNSAWLLEELRLALERDRKETIGEKADFGIWNQNLRVVYLRVRAEDTVLNGLFRRLPVNISSFPDIEISYHFTKKGFYNVVWEVKNSLNALYNSLFVCSSLPCSFDKKLKEKMRDMAFQFSCFYDEVDEIQRKIEVEASENAVKEEGPCGPHATTGRGDWFFYKKVVKTGGDPIADIDAGVDDVLDKGER